MRLYSSKKLDLISRLVACDSALLQWNFMGGEGVQLALEQSTTCTLQGPACILLCGGWS